MTAGYLVIKKAGYPAKHAASPKTSSVLLIFWDVQDHSIIPQISGLKSHLHTKKYFLNAAVLPQKENKFF